MSNEELCKKEPMRWVSIRLPVPLYNWLEAHIRTRRKHLKTYEEQAAMSRSSAIRDILTDAAATEQRERSKGKQ